MKCFYSQTSKVDRCSDWTITITKMSINNNILIRSICLRLIFTTKVAYAFSLYYYFIEDFFNIKIKTSVVSAHRAQKYSVCPPYGKRNLRVQPIDAYITRSIARSFSYPTHHRNITILESSIFYLYFFFLKSARISCSVVPVKTILSVFFPANPAIH